MRSLKQDQSVKWNTGGQIDSRKQNQSKKKTTSESKSESNVKDWCSGLLIALIKCITGASLQELGLNDIII